MGGKLAAKLLNEVCSTVDPNDFIRILNHRTQDLVFCLHYNNTTDLSSPAPCGRMTTRLGSYRGSKGSTMTSQTITPLW